MTAFYKKPDVLDALPMLGNGIIEASAGTGKTYTLEHLVVELLLRHEDVELENILVVTFTEKATAELRARVRKLLSSVVAAASRGGDAVRGEGEVGWEIDDAQRRKLERALFAFDVAPIYTIHGFCQRVLTEYAFASGRAFEQHHAEIGPLFERAFTEAMRRTLSCRDETRVWLEAWLEVGGVDDLRDLLMRAMASRAEIWPIYRGDALQEGLDEFGDNFWETYRELYKRRCESRERAFRAAQRDWVKHKSVARFLMRIDKEVVDLKHSLHNVDRSTPRHERFIKLVARLTRFKPAIAQRFLPLMSEALELEKDRQAAYTYDDMLTLVRDALSGPSGPRLTQALRRRHRWALIDEFQDTDEVQWDIFERLFVERDDGGVVVIGDPKQAIYGFRNADVYTYIDACRALEARAADGGAPCARVQLTQNWRSTPRLIDAYNALLDQSRDVPFFSSKDIRYDHPVRAGDEDLMTLGADGGELAPIVIGAMKRRDGENATSVKTTDVYACYGRWVASEIRSILDGGPGAIRFGKAGAEEAVGAKDIYVLTRTHSDAARLEEHLRALDIPYVIHREEDLFSTKEARSVLELLSAIERPHERSRRLKAWATPFFGVPLDELVGCRDVGEGHPLYRSLLTWSGLARQQRYEQLFASVLRGSGIVRREVFAGEDERALTNYLQLFEVLLEEARLGRVDFPELVARTQAFIQKKRRPLSEDGAARRAEADRDAVQIMTMHKSKGLEAPVVFLYAFGGFSGEYWPFHYDNRAGERVRALHILKPERKIRPKLHARVEDESKQEDERLLYVALTRAKARVYLPLVPCVNGTPICKYIASRSYNAINRRLDEVWGDVMAGEEKRGLFELQEIPYFGAPPRARPVEANPDVVAAWSPRARLLEDSPEESVWRSERARALRVESYTSLKRRAGGYAQVDAALDSMLIADDEVGTLEATISTDELPGGVRTGQFLHILLERLDYASLTRHSDFEQWAEDASVVELFERAMLEHGFGPEYLTLSQRIVHRALTGTVPLGEDGVAYGVGLCVPNVREMEFLYPIPERDHPALGEELNAPLEIGRGFVKGYIDYVFEQWGRVYFLDWKSDILDRYDEATLGLHFEANYARQAELYALALCKLLEISDEETYEQRFGGAVYGFLRGISEDGDHGWYWHRPTWAQVRAVHDELMGHGWGGSR